jgi:hypothetical protein
MGWNPSSARAQDKPYASMGDFGLQLIFNSIDSPIARIKAKIALVKKLPPEWERSGGDAATLQSLMEKVSQYGKKHHFEEAEKTLDEILALIGATFTPADNTVDELHRQERNGFIENGRKFNIAAVEEYVGWSVVEFPRFEPGLCPCFQGE